MAILNDGEGFYIDKYCHKQSRVDVFFEYVFTPVFAWACLILATWGLLKYTSDFGGDDLWGIVGVIVFLLIYILLMLSLAVSSSLTLFSEFRKALTNENYTLRKKYCCIDTSGIYIPTNNNALSDSMWVAIYWDHILSIKHTPGSDVASETKIDIEVSDEEYVSLKHSINAKFIGNRSENMAHLRVIYNSLPDEIVLKLKCIKGMNA